MKREKDPFPWIVFSAAAWGSGLPAPRQTFLLPPPLQQGECFWEHAGDWIPAESSPSKIAIFKLNHFPNHTLKLLPFLASSLQLFGMQASMDLEDAGFSGAALIPFCRFLHPSVRASVRPSLPSAALWTSTALWIRGRATSLTLTEIYKELLLFPPNYCQEKRQAAEHCCCLIGHSVLSKIQPFAWRAEGCWSLLKGLALVVLNKVRSKKIHGDWFVA